VDELERLKKAIEELKRYFTSGNQVPVDRATIKAEEFYRIIGEERPKNGDLHGTNYRSLG